MDRVPRVGILGYGEIGSAIASLYRRAQCVEPDVSDPGIGIDCDLDLADVIHVATPGHVVSSVCTLRPRWPLYIVHSTVPVGTCRAIHARNVRVVHAPVRGVHPHLAAGLRTFTMPVSGDVDEDVSAAQEVLRSLGIHVTAWPKWETTELAKLLCTTRLGIDVLWMRHVHDLCEKHEVPFHLVYEEWTKQYSDGFEMLGHWRYRRPILRPMPGVIGGHCVVPNAAMLAKHSSWAEMVATEGARPWRPMDVSQA